MDVGTIEGVTIERSRDGADSPRRSAAPAKRGRRWQLALVTVAVAASAAVAVALVDGAADSVDGALDARAADRGRALAAESRLLEPPATDQEPRATR